MSMAIGSKLQLEAGSFLETLYDIYIGVVVGANHSIYIVSRWWYVTLLRPLLRSVGLMSPEVEYTSEQEASPDTNNNTNKGLQVVAVGYGRTGTYSLMLALEELGYPTLHTQHLYEQESIIEMWTNEVFLPAVQSQHASMGTPNFQLIADAGFSATADLPMALYFDQLSKEFPDCQFILTTRDSSETWFRSWDTLTKSITKPTHLGAWFFTNVRQYSLYLRWLFAVVNKDDSYLTVSLPLPDQQKEAAIASYEEHNRNVRATIPSDRLLEYNVKEGWDPLCQFLRVAECPETPFPKTNSARSVQVQAISATIIPLIVALFVIFYAFARIVKASTGQSVLQWAYSKCMKSTHWLRCALMGTPVVTKKQKSL